jgi:hypothetical protein
MKAMASRRSVAFLGGVAPTLCALLCLSPGPAAQAQTPLGTAFTYQGQLNDAGSPADGVYDFEFRLFDSPAATNQVGPTATVGDLPVAAGLFTATLDFGGSVFAGDKRWLEIRVRPGASSGGYTVLSPVQELTASPNALFSSTASRAPWSGLTGVPAGFADNTDNDVVGGLSCANGQVAKWNGAAWVCAADADSGGDITAVTAGTGLTGGGTAGAVTVSANFGGSGSAAAVSHSDHDHFGQSWTGTATDGLAISNSAYSSHAVRGSATATTGPNYGVYGQSSSLIGAGVFGSASATTGFAEGVHGESAATQGRGVLGYATATTGRTYGVFGQATSTAGVGVYGVAPASTGYTVGVWGLSSSTVGQGVYGSATATTGNTYGVWGSSDSIGGRGVYGSAYGSAGGYGVYGWVNNTASGYAGYFAGSVHVTGTLSKGGGGFKIDHPLDPGNKYLYHSFVESPDMKNIYDGVVTTNDAGYATVELPEWFGALNKDFRYQLTVIGQFAQAIVAEEIADNRFSIRTSLAGVKVSWQVTGIRKDPFAEKHRIPVEQDKSEAERGKYLHPAAYGQPEERGVDFEHRPKLPPHEARGGEPIADAAAAP